MKNLEVIAEELFNKIRGRFPSVTIGNGEGKVTNVPTEARYYDFEYKESGRTLGKVSVSLDEKSISVMYSDDFVANEDQQTQNNWFNFLKELRQFSKRRLLNFDTRNITKSNLDRRDYKFLATTRPEEGTMTESTMYGTSKTSFQNIGSARIAIKHNKPVNQELATGRTQHVNSIYVESNEGERFKYPYKHLNGARAMARHVAEGGKPYDDFGKYITGLSEELAKLKKFRSYMSRSAVMAEGLAPYVDTVKERVEIIKKEVQGLQKENFYKEFKESFIVPEAVEVPDDVKENWIDELTIKQFNEELADVFPYIYKLVSETTRAKELNPEDFAEADAPQPTQSGPDTADDDLDIRRQGNLDRIQGPAGTVKVRQGMTLFSIAQMFNDQNNMGGDVQQFVKDIMELNKITNPQSLQVGQVLKMPYSMGTGRDGASRGLPPMGFTAYEDAIENAFEEMMGQFGESDDTMDVKINSKGQLTKADDEEEQKTPVGEFILSYFDYTTGQFPKGETAILTMVEKDYGERFINPAKQFIERINNRVAEVMGYKDNEVEENRIDRIISDPSPSISRITSIPDAEIEELLRGYLGWLQAQSPNHFAQAQQIIKNSTSVVPGAGPNVHTAYRALRQDRFNGQMLQNYIGHKKQGTLDTMGPWNPYSGELFDSMQDNTELDSIRSLAGL